MRRKRLAVMSPRLRNPMVALLVICALVAAVSALLWAVSHFRADQVGYFGRESRLMLLVDRGEMTCEIARGDMSAFGGPRWYWSSEAPGGFGPRGTSTSWYHKLGFDGQWGQATSF